MRGWVISSRRRRRAESAKTTLPRAVLSREDPVLERKVRRLAQGFGGIASVYVEDIATGQGAAWNARARYPAASTVKLAIAVETLRRLRGPPPAGSELDTLLRDMLVYSDNDAANALEVWLAGSTSAASYRIDSLLRETGLRDTTMYGGYEIGSFERRIPASLSSNELLPLLRRQVQGAIEDRSDPVVAIRGH